MSDQLCVGLADAEFQEDLLKHPDQSLSVEDTIKFVEVRAAGKRSALTPPGPSSTRTKTRLLSPVPIASSSAARPLDKHKTRARQRTPNQLRTNPTSQQRPTNSGMRNHTSDTLSRHPSGIHQPACLELQDDHYSSAATRLLALPAELTLAPGFCYVPRYAGPE